MLAPNERMWRVLNTRGTLRLTPIPNEEIHTFINVNEHIDCRHYNSVTIDDALQHNSSKGTQRLFSLFNIRLEFEAAVLATEYAANKRSPRK